ncbi:MAG: type II toxin-antitoxin system RelE/ParE family toxin [Clostridia bacterium]|nr:type II toxin-antitoxin system RelE/ParE family toxin [Clostridia bacterium]
MQQDKKINYVVRYSDYFWEEVDEIIDYMLDNYYESTVTKFKENLLEILDNITSFPKMYAPYYKDNRYRKVNIKNYNIFYRIDDKDQITKVYHIYDSRKDSFNLN